MYQATIYFETEENTFEQGCTGKPGTSWTEKQESESLWVLRAWVLDCTYSQFEDINQESSNGYPDATEYWANYIADADNNKATPEQVEAWKKGKERLWLVTCHILVSEIIKNPATL
jgi:hypothetical protein